MTLSKWSSIARNVNTRILHRDANLSCSPGFPLRIWTKSLVISEKTAFCWVTQELLYIPSASLCCAILHMTSTVAGISLQDHFDDNLRKFADVSSIILLSTAWSTCTSKIKTLNENTALYLACECFRSVTRVSCPRWDEQICLKNGEGGKVSRISHSLA